MSIDLSRGRTLAEHNERFAATEVEFFLCLDPGIRIDRPWSESFVDDLARVLEADPHAAAVGPAFAGEGVRWQTGLADNGEIVTGGETPEVLDGSCLMIRRAAIPDGEPLFDPRYAPFGYEDADLCLRLRARGWGLAQASITVEPPSSVNWPAPDPEGVFTRNLAKFRRRWAFYIREKRFDERVLVRRSHAKGDAFLATAIIETLRCENPGRILSFDTAHPELCPPGVEWRQGGFADARAPESGEPDLRIDLDDAYELRPHLPILEAYARAAGVEHLDLADPYLGDGGPVSGSLQMRCGPFVVLHATASPWGGRNWPPERWGALAAALTERGLTVIQIGQGSDPRIEGTEDHRISGASPSFEFCGLVLMLRQAQGFVGTDSFPFHVAQAVGIPAVALFGAILPERRIWTSSLRTVGVQAPGVACLGCHHRDIWTHQDRRAKEGRARPKYHSTCPRAQTDRCMDAISVEQVLEVCADLF